MESGGDKEQSQQQGGEAHASPLFVCSHLYLLTTSPRFLSGSSGVATRQRKRTRKTGNDLVVRKRMCIFAGKKERKIIWQKKQKTKLNISLQ